MQYLRRLLLGSVVLFGLAGSPAALAQEPCGQVERSWIQDLVDVVYELADSFGSQSLEEPGIIASPARDNQELLRLADHPSLANAPDRVRLSRGLVDGMAVAWRNSLPVVDGVKTAQEQGGVFVQKTDGSFEWRPGAPGDAGSFSPNWEDVGPGESVVTLVHTHPYAESEGGYTNVPFSGQDMGLMVLDGLYGFVNETGIVRSGSSIFLVSPSAELESRMAGLSDAQKVELWREIKADTERAVWAYAGEEAGSDAKPDEVLAVLRENFAEANFYAVKTVAEKYDFLFYAGRGDTLRRVN